MVVYLVQSGVGGPVKIGSTRDFRSRLDVLQVGSFEPLTVLRLFDGGISEERILQKKFADQRLRGEWFSFTEAMLGDVGLQEAGPPTPPIRYQSIVALQAHFEREFSERRSIIGRHAVH